MTICTRCGSRNVEGAQVCGNCGAPVSGVAIPNPAVSANPACKVCDRGTLMRRKMRRLSGPAVAIGYILLIPSILGMAACAILFIVGLFAAVTAATHSSAFGTAFAGIWNLFDMLIGVGCFVGGLVGWLLIMKKHVLQCVYCGAVVDAAAPIALQPNQSRVNARNFVLGVLLILGITGAIWAFIKAGTQTSAPTATTAESAQPAPDNSAPTVQSSLPNQVGVCVSTTVRSVGTRLDNTPGSGSAVTFTNGGYQVSYDTVAAVENSRAGDQITMCLVSIPKDCPPGDDRGREYKATNLRTGESWILPDSEHGCGGA